MWVALSGLVALACVLAAGRRLALAIAPLPIDPGLLVASLDRIEKPGLPLLAAASESRDLAVAGDLWAALGIKSVAHREAVLSEELLELHWLVDRWSLVPGVCARVASSCGFLFASIALVQAMRGQAPGAPMPDVSPAIDALAVGVAGASFCFAVHLRARSAARVWRVGMDRLVARMAPE